MVLVDPFDGVAVPRDLITEFFAVFARCEYAMKETSYKRDDHGIAAPAWLRLADEAAVWLDVPSGSDVALAIALLTSDPPKLLYFVDGWKSSPLRGANPIAQAIDAATRVRHNLFHGGKHTPEAEAGRDEQLVRAALTLLVELVDQCPTDLRGAYNHG
ncbi:hypothetical protein C9I57_27060 [Trinickia symbiotica]|uniref:Apea-like HEPN domain-containing protein n=1 Tax=Trinickia symbiotica TaxID=863227 RepID=A0A2T3XM58_9BURK|nr:hypothetical protein [Trinickia symbiotica]PTB17603.1 hypothetical protein C9I57_27060 [Trinickia symbiotica]